MPLQDLFKFIPNKLPRQSCNVKSCCFIILICNIFWCCLPTSCFLFKTPMTSYQIQELLSLRGRSWFLINCENYSKMMLSTENIRRSPSINQSGNNAWKIFSSTNLLLSAIKESCPSSRRGLKRERERGRGHHHHTMWQTGLWAEIKFEEIKLKTDRGRPTTDAIELSAHKMQGRWGWINIWQKSEMVVD